MGIFIVDNKKLDMTHDEYQMYGKICRSYDAPNRKGEDYFIDLFESDDAGIIMFLKSPSKKFCSMEIFLFLVALQTHQHLRIMHKQVDDVCAQMKNKMQELEAKLK